MSHESVDFAGVACVCLGLGLWCMRGACRRTDMTIISINMLA